MPNRIIKESICTSESVHLLNWFQQVLFIRLICSADDYGVFDARPAVIKGRCFPLDTCSTKDIEYGLTSMASAGIVILYSNDNKPYGQFTSWAEHQRVRNSQHKYPTITDVKSIPAATCRNSPQFAAISGPIQSNPIQSESESKRVANATAHSHGEYGWVKLTDEQYQKLRDDLGPEELERCINYIDESAQSTGNKNKWKDWNLVIRKCYKQQWGLSAGTTRVTMVGAQKPVQVDVDELRGLLDKV